MDKRPAAPARQRLDQLLVDRGLVDSRTRAQALIRAGEVTVNGRREDKPGHQLPVDAEIVLRARPPFVGRGGIKLDGALERLGIVVKGLVCLDVGASTGGFTDCLLQRGAVQVFAVDVGRAQLAWSLRQDPRVLSMERQDIRRLEPLQPPPELAVIDVSFISLTLVLPAVRPLLSSKGSVVALVKPQFEAGRAQVGRGGVIRDPELHRAVLARLVDWCHEAGWRILGACPSPLPGGDGNREFFLHLMAGEGPGDSLDQAAVLAACELA